MNARCAWACAASSPHSSATGAWPKSRRVMPSNFNTPAAVCSSNYFVRPTPMTLLKPSPVLLLLLLSVSQSAAALQILDARDGDTVLGKISQKEVTRISFERGRIRKITGNAGEFVLE